MRRFVRTSVPTDGYEQVAKVGGRWLVRLEPDSVAGEDGTVTCYECICDEEPDLDVLGSELQAWKAHVAERELNAVKIEKIKSLTEYDRSPAVNSFELRMNGEKVTDYWIDRDLRQSLDGDVRAAKEVGSTYNFDVRELGVTLTLDCDKFLDALGVLRRYAYTAYNVTSRHMAAIASLTTKEDVEGYDFTANYPPKLVFNIENLM